MAVLIAEGTTVFIIRFTTTRYRPSRVISLRTSRGAAANGAWTEIQELGAFEGDHWEFRLDEREFPAGTRFKFVLDGTWWSNDPDLTMRSEPGAIYTYDEAGFSFQTQNRLTDLLVEQSAVQRQFFKPAPNRVEPWDVIVIGSGMGGGIVAHALAQKNLDVLILEAGSYLFPEHVANLPRQHLLGRFSKHVWDLWDEFEVRNYANASGSSYTGGQAYNFGGRSIFWGGLVPRMTDLELEAWPAAIRADLKRGGYRAAEDLMHARPSPRSDLHLRVKNRLRAALPELIFRDAPVAVQARPPSPSTIPAGMFSTADLLMEAILTESQGDEKDRHLFINLNHRVQRLELGDGDRPRVVARDLVADQERTFTAKTVVLAAGPIESPLILERSCLPKLGGPVGIGITDHPSFYMHFVIPHFKDGQASPFFDAECGSKLIARYRSERDHRAFPFNVVVEVGADFNQGRYVDKQIFQEHQEMKHDEMLCEVVFMLNVDLVEANTVRLGAPPGDRALVSMRASDLSPAVRLAMTDVKEKIVTALGGEQLGGPFPDDAFTLQEAKLGAAGHETGTLRLKKARRTGPDGPIGPEPDWVVDDDLKLRGYDNVYVCDLSVFPVSPAANPSLTLAALALRLANHI